MWKYIDKNQCNEFLLSLNLIDNKLIDKDKIKKLYTISNKIEKNYKIFKIKKSNGKFRTIYEPNYTLKSIQRQILKNILNNKTISSYAKAYHKGIGLKDNASPHINKKIILKLDIKDFFNNINFFNIYNSCFPLEYFPKSIGMLLTYLCTYDEHLPQGAPTSAYISNLVMRDFDYEIGDWCKERKINYTRYSDDMTFSGDFIPSDIIKIVKKNLYKLNLELNNEKTHVIKNSCRQSVTGIVVNEKLQINNKYRKQIRQEMYYVKKYGIESHVNRINYNQENYLTHLYGKILFVLQINMDDEFIQYKNYLKENYKI